MRRVIGSLAIAVIIGWVVWLLWGRLSPFQRSVPPVAKPLPPPLSYDTKPVISYLAPDFELKTLEGNEVRLGDYLGRVVVVDFWATWCPFCRSEMPSLGRFAAAAPKDIVVLAINRGELPEVVSDFRDRYIHPPANMLLLVDPDDTIYRRYLGTSMPQSFYIDRDGVIRSIARRELLLGEMRNAAAPLMAAPAACAGKKYGKNC